MRGAWFAIVVVLAVLAVVAVGGYIIYKYRLRVRLLIILLNGITNSLNAIGRLCAIPFCVLSIPPFLHAIQFLTPEITACFEITYFLVHCPFDPLYTYYSSLFRHTDLTLASFGPLFQCDCQVLMFECLIKIILFKGIRLNIENISDWKSIKPYCSKYI